MMMMCNWLTAGTYISFLLPFAFPHLYYRINVVDSPCEGLDQLPRILLECHKDCTYIIHQMYTTHVHIYAKRLRRDNMIKEVGSN